MTVQEYVRTFERGCYFVPMIGNDPEEKLSHFVEGLKPMFKMNVRLSVPKTFREAVALDSSREALSSYIILGGFSRLDQDREVVVFGRVFVRTGAGDVGEVWFVHQTLRAFSSPDVNASRSSCSLPLVPVARSLSMQIGTRRLVTAFGLLGNPGVGLATRCCLYKTPAFGYKDQSLQTRFLGTLVVVIVAHKYGFPGYTAGRGADPAIGAPGGG
ncbi:hypothetical protein F511_17807 [Dorcoceras hygrometricum]|uniref:Retrotransposon gag domain-containing protein n=1 Tax=Dorcoceras hygrometricum TaxID=472368 RepID=A0A2Z7AUV3_9LAMI|nr:hypothetical protein F511_17807 [Dorcoceras hygrometricum]